MKLEFTKMHGIGNDYIYVNCLDKALNNPAEISKLLSPRHKAVGADGLVCIEPSTVADIKMRMFNADGSEAQMCGNAVRCIAKYVYEKNLCKKDVINLETKAGIIKLEIQTKGSSVESVRVNMGKPILKSSDIPTLIDSPEVTKFPLQILDQTFEITCVSMGNPHAVIFVPEITEDHVHKYGSVIENHELFPERINVEFIKVISKNEVDMRVWERGSGETQACGTGAAAAVVAGVINGLLSEQEVVVHLLGGDLKIEWVNKESVFKTGPASFSFDGSVDI